MPAGIRGISRRKSQHDDPAVVTAGKIFSDGIIELVSSPDGCRPRLFFWDGKRARVASRIRHDGVWYVAPRLDPSIGRAIRLPGDVNRSGSAVEFFAHLVDLFQKYLALPREVAQTVTVWVTSTWLSDLLPSPPVLLISGPHMGRAIDLFQLLGCGSRRALSLAGITRVSLCGLPMDLRPSLLINQPDLPQGLSRLLLACNHRGVNVPGKSGTIQDWVVPKAMFMGSAPSPSAWGGEALWISLPSAGTSLHLNQHALEALARDLQAKFLAFRLDWLCKAHEGVFSDSNLSFPESGLAQTLFTCVRYAPELIDLVNPLLCGLVEDAKLRLGLDPSLVILEELWDPAHKLRSLSVKKITEYLNVTLRTRGNLHEYSAEEVGWILTRHGFERHRNASGKLVRFTGEDIIRLHQLTRAFGLDLPRVQDCASCAEPKTMVAQ